MFLTDRPLTASELDDVLKVVRSETARYLRPRHVSPAILNTAM